MGRRDTYYQSGAVLSRRELRSLRVEYVAPQLDMDALTPVTRRGTVDKPQIYASVGKGVGGFHFPRIHINVKSVFGKLKDAYKVVSKVLPIPKSPTQLLKFLNPVSRIAAIAKIGGLALSKINHGRIKGLDKVANGLTWGSDMVDAATSLDPSAVVQTAKRVKQV